MARVPGTRRAGGLEWAVAGSRFASGVVVTGVVLSHRAFGFFAGLGEPVIGLAGIPRVREPGQRVGRRDYPAVGSQVTAVVPGASDPRRQVRLSVRPSDLNAVT